MRLIKRNSERGASLVEFALVAPLFFLLIFAIIEGSALFYARNTIGLAAADASRAGSIDSFAADADVGIVKSLADAEDRVFGAKIDRIIIFRAEEDGAIPSAGCRSGVSDSTCAVYEPANFDSPSCSGWCPSNRQPDDLLGVWVETTYEGLSGMNPFNVTWSEQRFSLVEPEL